MLKIKSNYFVECMQQQKKLEKLRSFTQFVSLKSVYRII